METFSPENLQQIEGRNETTERAAAGRAEPGLCIPSKLLLFGVMGAPPPPGSHLQWLLRYAGEQSKRRDLQCQNYESKQTASFCAFQLGFQRAPLQNKAEGVYQPAGHSSAPETISPWMLSTSQAVTQLYAWCTG